jgi:hypothetical protein
VQNWVGDIRGGQRLGVFRDMVLRQYWGQKGRKSLNPGDNRMNGNLRTPSLLIVNYC